MYPCAATPPSLLILNSHVFQKFPPLLVHHESATEFELPVIGRMAPPHCQQYQDRRNTGDRLDLRCRGSPTQQGRAACKWKWLNVYPSSITRPTRPIIRAPCILHPWNQSNQGSVHISHSLAWVPEKCDCESFQNWITYLNEDTYTVRLNSGEMIELKESHDGYQPVKAYELYCSTVRAVCWVNYNSRAVRKSQSHYE